ncbi:hypothetical protein D3C81_1989670 [compost metagenome]
MNGEDFRAIPDLDFRTAFLELTFDGGEIEDTTPLQMQKQEIEKSLSLYIG